MDRDIEPLGVYDYYGYVEKSKVLAELLHAVDENQKTIVRILETIENLENRLNTLESNQKEIIQRMEVRDNMFFDKLLDIEVKLEDAMTGKKDISVLYHTFVGVLQNIIFRVPATIPIRKNGKSDKAISH